MKDKGQFRVNWIAVRESEWIIMIVVSDLSRMVHIKEKTKKYSNVSRRSALYLWLTL